MSPLRSDDPREVAGYRLLARIGEGGMGSVYLSHTRGNQPVALKLIRCEYAQDGQFRHRFQQEVQAARRVQGAHVVPVIDHDATGSQPWLATAYVAGLPLDGALTEQGPLPLPSVLQLIGCAAEALRAVHAAGVIHRDLKPSNILLGSDGPWVIDFGIARAADSTGVTRSGGLVGTPQYMSPEHANGESLTPATDVFSLGLIAAVAATGRHPYGEAGAITLAAQIANTGLRSPDLAGYPEPLRPILERCLAADPASRPTPAELTEMCEEASGRPLRDFGGWLPQPVTAEIARLKRAAQVPPAPAPAAMAPGYTPTYVPPPGFGPPRPARLPASARVALAVGGGVLAVVLAVATTYALTGGRDTAGDVAAGSGGTPAAAPAQPPDTEAAPSGPSDSASSSPTAASYTLLFKDKPLTIRAPDDSYTIVDLDLPRVDPNGEDDLDEDAEIAYSYFNIDAELAFKTGMGTSTGRTPEECLASAQTDPLPGTLKNDALKDGDLIAKGSLLCTVTTKHNLALLEITGLTPGTNYDGTPTYSAKLTLWQMP